MPIELRGLGFTYLPGTPMAREVLSAIDLELREGEILCVMGRTGAGKSTLINIMSGLLSPTCGEILLEGKRMGDSRTGGSTLRNAAGILLQSSEKQLFAETVERDVAFGPRNQGLSGEALSSRVGDALRIVGMDPGTYGPRSPFSLSEGEMRRVALAGVLAMRPRYLLLDEPSSGLDILGKEMLHSVLLELHREGVGILLVTHDWLEVERLADRVVLLHGGTITAKGSAEEVACAFDELREAGLRPPPMVEVMAALRARGLELPAHVTSPAKAAALICEAVRGGAG